MPDIGAQRVNITLTAVQPLLLHVKLAPQANTVYLGQLNVLVYQIQLEAMVV